MVLEHQVAGGRRGKRLLRLLLEYERGDGAGDRSHPAGDRGLVGLQMDLDDLLFAQSSHGRGDPSGRCPVRI